MQRAAYNMLVSTLETTIKYSQCEEKGARNPLTNRLPDNSII